MTLKPAQIPTISTRQDIAASYITEQTPCRPIRPFAKHDPVNCRTETGAAAVVVANPIYIASPRHRHPGSRCCRIAVRHAAGSAFYGSGSRPGIRRRWKPSTKPSSENPWKLGPRLAGGDLDGDRACAGPRRPLVLHLEGARAGGRLVAGSRGGLGITLCFHRLLTHGSFQTYRPVRWLLTLFGTFSGEGSAITWVANHRKHHAHSDKPGDPHSPHDGPWWSHMFWFTPCFGKTWHEELTGKYAPDLRKDPVMRFLHIAFLPLQIGLGGVLFAIGYFGWDAYTAWSFVFWGVFVRMVYVWHVTWFVNSATHMWGYRNYETSDDSTNLWWVGLLAFGEGWHNNHHAFQRMARHGHKWWEVDVTYLAICVMEKLRSGLERDPQSARPPEASVRGNDECRMTNVLMNDEARMPNWRRLAGPQRIAHASH